MSFFRDILTLPARHRRLVSLVKKLMLAWPMGNEERTIPHYIVRDLCAALLDEPGAKDAAKAWLADLDGV